MELAGPLTLLQAQASQANVVQVNDSQLIAPHDGIRSQPALASAQREASLDSRTHRQKPARFDDILDQTLAGPLFATWSPTATIVPTGKLGATNASVAALDANGRRDGRKRSRR